MEGMACQTGGMPTPIILLHSALPLRTSTDRQQGAAKEGQESQEHPPRANPFCEEKQHLERVAQSVDGGGAKGLVELEGKEA